jgi:hypothetical protein
MRLMTLRFVGLPDGSCAVTEVLVSAITEELVELTREGWAGSLFAR